ncbi:MAG: hypothetical protein Q8N53_10530 [Longimicrobiales bacterium]|nr:hypothetical protein [Longimicrobiales bacterium]
MRWDRIRSASQVAWLLLVVGFAVRFAWRHADELASLDLASGGSAWAVALLCLVGAKVMISLMVHASWRAAGADLGLRQAVYTYNMSQLPKYVPGGIWPYVSRVRLARARSLDFPRIWSGLAMETAMLLGGAVVLAALAFDAGALLPAVGVTVPVAWIAPARAGALALVGVGAAAAAARVPHRGALARAVVLTLAAWALIGLSFHAVVTGLAGSGALAGAASGAAGLVPTAGLFAFAWTLGFVAFFSPAGIGVREVLLGLGLAGVGPPAVVAAIVVGHRLVHFAADVLCAGAALAFFRPGPR